MLPQLRKSLKSGTDFSLWSLRYELQRVSERDEAERQKLMLQLENQMLRSSAVWLHLNRPMKV